MKKKKADAKKIRFSYMGTWLRRIGSWLLLLLIFSGVYLLGFQGRKAYYRGELDKLEDKLSRLELEQFELEKLAHQEKSRHELARRADFVLQVVGDLREKIRNDFGKYWPADMREAVTAAGIQQLINGDSRAAFVTPGGLLIFYSAEVNKQGVPVPVVTRERCRLVEDIFKRHGVDLSGNKVKEFYTELTLAGIAHIQAAGKRGRVDITAVLSPDYGVKIYERGRLRGER